MESKCIECIRKICSRRLQMRKHLFNLIRVGFFMRSVLHLHRWNSPALPSILVVLHSAIRLRKPQVTQTPRGGFCRNTRKCAPAFPKTPIPFGQEASRKLYGQLILHRLLPSRWRSSGQSNRATCSERGFGKRAFLHQSLLSIQHRKLFPQIPRGFFGKAARMQRKTPLT